jgi:hypothetical protein
MITISGWRGIWWVRREIVKPVGQLNIILFEQSFFVERKVVKKSDFFLSKKVTHFVTKNEHHFFGQKWPKVIFFKF